MKDVTLSVEDAAYDLGASVATIVVEIKKAAADGLDINDAVAVAPHVMPLVAAVQKLTANPVTDKGALIQGLLVGLSPVADALVD